MTSLEERVARAMCNKGHGDRLYYDDLPAKRKEAWLNLARAAIAVCAEEMAQTAYIAAMNALSAQKLCCADAHALAGPICEAVRRSALEAIGEKE